MDCEYSKTTKMFLSSADASTTAMLLSAIAALTGVITFMGKWVLKRLDDCEGDRDSLWRALADYGHGSESAEQMKERYSRGGPSETKD